ncbi:hypothetical protein NECAME_00260 [Necator americanus]|uniref:Uncharacterized protein n=1 Tax=Necator americanus TaxID=51031 RepID=W2TJV6_NECAM|nr:hypothetical protein NECAME_00260 [Necator americanus]ETN81909.1 hypothetical protein NECAME_00260 [Necator americanus]
MENPWPIQTKKSLITTDCTKALPNKFPFSDRRLFAEDYDAVSEARDADDWLTHKLRKVKSKRDIDPDQMRRRNQERMLLEVGPIEAKLLGLCTSDIALSAKFLCGL